MFLIRLLVLAQTKSFDCLVFSLVTFDPGFVLVFCGRRFMCASGLMPIVKNLIVSQHRLSLLGPAYLIRNTIMSACAFLKWFMRWTSIRLRLSASHYPKLQPRAAYSVCREIWYPWCYSPVFKIAPADARDELVQLEQEFERLQKRIEVVQDSVAEYLSKKSYLKCSILDSRQRGNRVFPAR